MLAFDYFKGPVLIGSVLVNLIAEYAMFPHLAGRGLALSAAIVFISLLFWGWILGGIGVLIAVPLPSSFS